MANNSRFFQLDGLIALSFFLTNLARTGWIVGTAKLVLLSLILLSIGFIVMLFFTQRGHFTLSPVGIVAVVIGFLPSVFWYITRMVQNLELMQATSVFQKIYEFTNYASMALVLAFLPYLFFKRSK